MNNPFSINYPDQADADLVTLAKNGNKEALKNLVLRHQVFIYNLAFKMTRSEADAEDLTQEVLIKAITALAKFQGKSSFRTWLYRITVNHFVNARKQKSRMEYLDFETYFDQIDNIPNQDLNEEEKTELADTIEDLRISCTAGMLLCLSKEQRLLYILGDIFEIDHQMGAEIYGISAGNFRIRLMRARQDLYNWMNKRCGLINLNNPCRCAKKTRSFIATGLVNPESLKFNIQHQTTAFEVSANKSAELMETFDDLYQNVFQTHPMRQPLTTSKIVDEVVNHDFIKMVLGL